MRFLSLRFVEDLKRPVLEVLEECIWDENSQLFQLRGFWDSGVKVKSRILEELEAYWTRLAQQGRTLEEAARWSYNHISNHLNVLKNVAGLLAWVIGGVIVEMLRVTLSWQSWWRLRGREERLNSSTSRMLLRLSLVTPLSSYC